MLTEIANILNGNLFTGISNIIGKFVEDPTQKAELAEKVQELAAQQAALVEQSAQKEMEAQQAIMTAEMSQDDKYTKRARPTIVYSGLVAMFLNYVVLPWMAYFTHGGTTLPPISVPDYFWGIWGGVCGVYVLGRTVEKTGGLMPFTQAQPPDAPTVSPVSTSNAKK
jgi:outer membrane murein-binding lipoprotein Lpp